MLQSYRVSRSDPGITTVSRPVAVMFASPRGPRTVLHVDAHANATADGAAVDEVLNMPAAANARPRPIPVLPVGGAGLAHAFMMALTQARDILVFVICLVWAELRAYAPLLVTVMRSV